MGVRSRPMLGTQLRSSAFPRGAPMNSGGRSADGERNSFLRATLVLVVRFISAIAEPWVLAHADQEEQERAITALEELGAKVDRDESVAGRPVVTIRVVLREKECLRLVKAFPTLKTLVARFGQLSDDDLKPLEGLTRVETLNLDSNEITDAGLSHLEGLRSLRVLARGQRRHQRGLGPLEGSLKARASRTRFDESL